MDITLLTKIICFGDIGEEFNPEILKFSKQQQQTMSTTIYNGHNAYQKHGLPNQNSGEMTPNQLKQSSRQRVINIAHRSIPAFYPTLQFSLGPWTHSSKSNFKSNRYFKVGSQAR